MTGSLQHRSDIPAASPLLSSPHHCSPLTIFNTTSHFLYSHTKPTSPNKYHSCESFWDFPPTHGSSSGLLRRHEVLIPIPTFREKLSVPSTGFQDSQSTKLGTDSSYRNVGRGISTTCLRNCIEEHSADITADHFLLLCQGHGILNVHLVGAA